MALRTWFVIRRLAVARSLHPERVGSCQLPSHVLSVRFRVSCAGVG